LTDFHRFIRTQPHDYWCLVSGKPDGESVRIPELAAGGRQLYTPPRLRAFSAKRNASAACAKGEEVLPLLCLSCFVNILRSRVGIEEMLLDGEHICEVRAWRSPCETTAILRHETGAYFAEGCRETGVFWRPVGELPGAPPPLSRCGALEGDCVWGKCHLGWPFLDAEPTTLCSVTAQRGLRPGGQYAVWLETPELRLRCVGVSEEGFDLAPEESGMTPTFKGKVARRLAIAAANSLFGWEGGILAGQPDCRITVTDRQDNVCLTVSSTQPVD